MTARTLTPLVSLCVPMDTREDRKCSPLKILDVVDLIIDHECEWLYYPGVTTSGYRTKSHGSSSPATTNSRTIVVAAVSERGCRGKGIQ